MNDIVVCRDCNRPVSKEITEKGDDQPYFWCNYCANKFNPYSANVARNQKWDPVKDINRIDVVDSDMYYNSVMNPQRRIMRMSRLLSPRKYYGYKRKK